MPKLQPIAVLSFTQSQAVERNVFFLCSDRVNRNIFSGGPLKIFLSDGSLYLRATKKQRSRRSTFHRPFWQNDVIFAFAVLLHLALLLRFILLTLTYGRPMGIAKSPLRGVSRCFPV
jgi:hypothetical protein